MLYLNQATFAGTLGNISTGDKHAFLSLAVDKTYKDKDGNKQTRTDWIEIAVFRGNLVTFVKEHLSKGKHVYVELIFSATNMKKTGKKSRRCRSSPIASNSCNRKKTADQPGRGLRPPSYSSRSTLYITLGVRYDDHGI